jgi:D-alanyl-lipoteichoic acid acyltransferase DltB (MBOAT superfamily)
VLFAFQLYGDFSGYSDIARGAARVLGFSLMNNFEQPYFSKSIGEFWRRWHISLSSWLRDYLYFPLLHSASRMSIVWMYCAIVITFLVSGLWHGAGWNYVAMGGLHGIYLVTGMMTKKIRARTVAALGLTAVPRLYAAFQTLIAFGLVCFGWIFFRTTSLTHAWYIVTHLGTGWGSFFAHGITKTELGALAGSLALSPTSVVIIISSIVVLVLYELTEQHGDVYDRIARLPGVIRWGMYYALVLALCWGATLVSNRLFIFNFKVWGVWQ